MFWVDWGVYTQNDISIFEGGEKVRGWLEFSRNENSGSDPLTIDVGSSYGEFKKFRNRTLLKLGLAAL